MPSVYSQCPTCNEQIPGPNQAQANRNLGLHRRSRHGYHSPKYEEAKQYRRTYEAKKASVTPERLEQLRLAREARWSGHTKLSPAETRRQWRARVKHKTAEEIIQSQRDYNKRYREEHAEEIKAKKTAAYRAKISGIPNNTMEVSAAAPCNLPRCPICGSAFYVVRGQQTG